MPPRLAAIVWSTINDKRVIAHTNLQIMEIQRTVVDKLNALRDPLGNAYRSATKQYYSSRIVNFIILAAPSIQLEEWNMTGSAQAQVAALKTLR